MTVMTLEHDWVKHTITPVSALEGLEPDDPPVVVVDPDDQTIAEDNAAYGCNRCGVPMAGHFGTKCEGEMTDD